MSVTQLVLINLNGQNVFVSQQDLALISQVHHQQQQQQPKNVISFNQSNTFVPQPQLVNNIQYGYQGIATNTIKRTEPATHYAGALKNLENYELYKKGHNEQLHSRTDSASKYYTELVPIIAKDFGPESVEIGALYFNLGLYYHGKNKTNARRYLKGCEQIFKKYRLDDLVNSIQPLFQYC